MQVDCVAQNYAWGIKGSDSAVARFKKASDESFSANPNDCYAELWMGTHPSGPAKVLPSNQLLADYLASNPSTVGRVPQGYSEGNLPFLFKVLSVRTALSLQTHPDKKLAEELHRKFPDIYKDPNHKPEMVIALTPFECMCGFLKLSEIADNFKEYPEFRTVVDHQGVVSTQTMDNNLEESVVLKTLFTNFMACPMEVINNSLNQMITRLESIPTLTSLQKLILRLNQQYPNDIGVFSPLFTNYIELQPGQSFFIGANELHAYLSGECVECMALSDNVVRAGLTPKFKDCETLCNMLVYKSRLPSFLTPQSLDSCTGLYRPPADCCAEFEVERIEIPANTTDYHPITVDCGSLLLLLQSTSDHPSVKVTTVRTNESLLLREGGVVFTGANEEISITTGETGATFYRAHVNLDDA